MKKYRLFVVFSFCMVVMLTISCRGNRQDKPAEQGEASVMEIKIEGMTCTACEQTIQRKVGKLEGIKSVTATFTDGRAIIEYFPGKADTLKIKDAISGSGYVVKKISPSIP